MENNTIQFELKESTNNELNKENQSSIKRNCTNRHSLQNKNHTKLEFKNSLNKFSQRTQLSTLSNSISSIPVFEYLNKNETTLLSTSSDGAMTSNKKQSKDLNLIKTDNRLSPTTKLNYFTNESNYLNNYLSTNNTLSTNYEQKQHQNKTTNKRRASMTDNGYTNSGVSPTKMAISAIQEFVETSIVLKKGKDNQLGISIIGGSDTYLESICVKEVHEGTAAYIDGRIRKGDIILACNEYSFRTVNYADAVRVLKEASSPLKLLILRENPQKLFTTSQSPNKFITVELKKQSIKDKLGISLIQRTNGCGVFVTYVVPNSIAAIQGKGKILQGDQLLEINGQNVATSNQKDVANQLNQLDGELVLLLGRVPSLTSCIQEWCRKRMQIHWRTRTSTWSAYGGSKDKIQNQRPSLPVNTGKETPLFNAHSPEMESRPQSPFSSNRPSICSQIQLPLQSNKIETITKGQQFQQALSQQLNELQNQEDQKLFKQPLTYNAYSDKYPQACVNTPEDAISFSFSRSSSVRSRNRHLSVLMEDPCYNNKNTFDLDLNKDSNYLSKSPSLFSTNINHLFTDPDDSSYEIEPIDEQTTCYLAEKLDAENKFIPYDQLDKKDQQELMEQQLKQQRLAFKEERQALYQEKHHNKSKHHKQQIITSVNNKDQTHRHHKRSFLIRRSNSSKQATKKNHIPSIQVTEF